MYKNIFLIDDDSDDRELFMIALNNLMGHSIWDIAEHGREALKKLITADTAPDLIFCDLNMPLMSGQEFIREIKNLSGLKNIPIVVHTTTSDYNTIEEMRALGAYKFFPKPVKFDDLLLLLKPVLDDSFTGFVVK